MPCYTKQTITVDMGAVDRELLEAGLIAAGFRLQKYGKSETIATNKAGKTISIIDGKAYASKGDEAIINEAKKAYSTEVVKRMAAQRGLRIQTSVREPNKLKLTR